MARTTFALAKVGGAVRAASNHGRRHRQASNPPTQTAPAPTIAPATMASACNGSAAAAPAAGAPGVLQRGARLPASVVPATTRAAGLTGSAPRPLPPRHRQDEHQVKLKQTGISLAGMGVTSQPHVIRDRVAPLSGLGSAARVIRAAMSCLGGGKVARAAPSCERCPLHPGWASRGFLEILPPDREALSSPTVTL